MNPVQGDYERRHTGLLPLFRPPDLVSLEVMLSEMRAGLARVVPEWAATGYAIFRAYALTRGMKVGEHEDWMTPGHPLLYLQSALQIQGTASSWPHLVISAFQEFKDGSVSPVFSYPSGWSPVEDRNSPGRSSDSSAAGGRQNTVRRRTLRLEF